MPLRFAICGIASSALFGLVAGMPALVHASATAQGVALNANASCTTADLDLTLTTVGATREFGLATNLSGVTLTTFEQATLLLGTFSGTFNAYVIGPVGADPPWPPQPPGTMIASYAYVGTTPPTAATTAEFFVFYNCSTRQVRFSCFGPYGTCPKTAQQAAALPVPALDRTSLALAMLLLALSAFFLLRRRS